MPSRKSKDGKQKSQAPVDFSEKFDPKYWLHFIQTNPFTREWDSLLFDDEDMRRLQETFQGNPKVGPVMQGTGGLRKIRFGRDGRGKSGGVRVCYVYFEEFSSITLAILFPKNEMDDLNAASKRAIAQLIEIWYEEVRKRHGL